MNGAYGRDDAPSSGRLSATGETFVPPQRLAALIAGAYCSAPLVPIAALYWCRVRFWRVFLDL
jgi:hypothetical protein